ncbi:hypothetical protein [Bavariicoccus seileri]|uniref:hypothetical protein n=1 Tax=Bavariicoccus seileri TaxID=549685 RepID=UPI003F91B834
MENKKTQTEKTAIHWGTVFRFAGAYVAFIIGSGFATGQEVLQFLQPMVSVVLAVSSLV